MAKAQTELKLASTPGAVQRDLAASPWTPPAPLAGGMPRWAPTAPPSTRGCSSFQHFIVTDSARSPPRAAGTGTAPAQRRAPGREGAAGNGAQRGWGKAGTGDRAGLERCALGAGATSPGATTGAGGAPARPRGPADAQGGWVSRGAAAPGCGHGELHPCPLVPKAGRRSPWPHRPWDTGGQDE